jgi:putative transposase
MGMSDATFYNWKKKYGGLGVTELRVPAPLSGSMASLSQ